jgi:phosphate transport system substrate-binding protein
MACGGKETRGESFSLGGSTTVAPVIENAIEVLESSQPQYHIVYEAQGTGPGLQGVLKNTFILAGASRTITANEEAQGAIAYPFALDGLAIIVNDNVTINTISRAQLEAIYEGTITNWSELGGTDMPIEVVNREEGSGTRDSFDNLVMQGRAFNKNVITVDSNGNMSTTVLNTPGAIGYTGFSFINQINSRGGHVLTVDGIEATDANVRNKSYPLARELFMVSNGPLVDGTFSDFFVKWLLSAEGQEVVVNNGFIALN